MVPVESSNEELLPLPAREIAVEAHCNCNNRLTVMLSDCEKEEKNFPNKALTL